VGEKVQDLVLSMASMVGLQEFYDALLH
jgi:hypothetical protein